MSTLSTFDAKSDKKIVKLAEPARDSTDGLQRKPAPVIHLLANSDPALIRPITGFDATLKRSLDITVSAVALLALLPVLALISVLIKLDSAGPALFSQRRCGRDREPVNVLKFRTMYRSYSTPVPTASSFKQTRKDDPRVTRIGSILRKYSLDELPQLFNVLQGSMSLVGPRPHPAPLDEQYKYIIPGLSSRYTVKPGLTGWAQVNGFRGETIRVEDMVARVEHDCHYIKNWTLWLDIKIIAKTAIKGWTHHNAV